MLFYFYLFIKFAVSEQSAETSLYIENDFDNGSGKKHLTQSVSKREMCRDRSVAVYQTMHLGGVSFREIYCLTPLTSDFRNPDDLSYTRGTSYFASEQKIEHREKQERG
jgi:hypothetical protein